MGSETRQAACPVLVPGNMEENIMLVKELSIKLSVSNSPPAGSKFEGILTVA